MSNPDQRTEIQSETVSEIIDDGNLFGSLAVSPGPDFAFADLQRPFLLFNNQRLTMDPITDDDIAVIELSGLRQCKSAAWSANCEWFFVISNTAIFLLNVYNDKGYRCRKKSYRFIEAFLEAPPPKRSKSAQLRR